MDGRPKSQVKEQTQAEYTTFFTRERSEWRAWLAQNFERETQIWFVFPMKGAAETGLSYNDAVEEALCFGWIDSTIRNLDEFHRAQRFSPRKPGSGYSRANVERLIWLEKRGLLHPKIRESVWEIITTPYEYPADVLAAIKDDARAWENFENFPEAYKRIRVAYVDAARNRPQEYEKRLQNLIAKSRENKLFGYGGIDKYYHDDV